MQMVIKNILSRLIALVSIVILSPIILVVAILIKVNLGSPIFFKQTRIGKDNKEFKMIKFRSMRDGRDKNGELLSDEERLTKFGKFIRSTSLDELPELLNILIGNMAIVGPRPLLVKYLPLYSEEQLKRHNVLPGLTGLAQISGRNGISWTKKFNFDIYYVEHWSLYLDIKIFFMTFYKVFKKSDINQSENETMESFNGKN